MAIKRSTKSNPNKESAQNSEVEDLRKKTTTAKKNEPAKSYKELVVEALISLDDRRGSSRPAVKKYIKEKYPSVGSVAAFDSYFNNAIKKGVELKEFELPKGPSGTLKLVKKIDSSDENGKVEIRRSSRQAKSEEAKKLSTNSNSTANEKSRGRPKPNNNNNKVKVEKPQPKTKSKVVPSPTYKEMIISGILQLNDGKGSSRSALKKFVKDQYKNEIKASSNFDHLFNSALRKGIESGDLHQPKGPSGIVKVLKKKKASTAIKTA
ncbi:hypothetical protein ZYGR_0S01700 [Zygosaccharomyces rouxii]|uniref:Histone H1 n=2 Tax=Zygosaccharomyces rouxii TaxID=4956 RepID=C5DXM6_ZYGRC|nr:uncharacterized protein ZYRO0F06270g [Zygosaccharomyces rouxii]KAH9199297.1 linker histone H1 and H5 family-domain-containing protein [Zygosaccharomyces rouxii]GAV50036.1 hypothetical protein ZYGR_0S01700 [Zygosaccharomyces rouxii]CAR28537.1 ZYRO0F06270p [Zygosaccharomyces rouxii]